MKTETMHSIKKFFPILAFTIILAQGCSTDKAGQGRGGFAMPPMPVDVARVVHQDVADKFEAVGSIEAIEAITVVSEIDAAVTALPFEEGANINRGGLIAQLDDGQLSAEVQRTEALLAQSKTSYERVRSVVEQKAGTLQDLDNAEAGLKIAQSNLALAKARFAKTRITAPFDGTIGARKVSVGTFLRTGTPITELANLQEIRVNFSAPERFLPQIKKGAEVVVTSPVYPGYEVKGRIIVIEPVINLDTRSVRIVARVQNPAQKFRSGMSANVSVILNERPEALTIPSEAVFATGNQSFVFAVNPDSTVKRVAITTGLQLQNSVEILNGLQSGMTVVKAGHQKIFEGAKIAPTQSQDAIAKK
jgi:membrane fusion protein, multidrug efflux system